MKAFLAIKYHDNMQNKDTIESICAALESSSVKVFAFARDIQHYGACKMTPKAIMERAFKEIKSSDIFIIEASEISIGIGIEAGVAFSAGIPIYLIYKDGSNVSNSIKGIAKKQLVYREYKELSNLIINTDI